MNITIDRILSKARSLGACNLIDGVHDIKDLARLFFTPQGREFCIGHEFPNLPDFRILKVEKISYLNIFCDFGAVHREGGTNYCAVGKTLLQAKFDDNADFLHQIVLMHGAEAEIEISNHAVIHIQKTPDCKVHINNIDKTGIVLW